eukprot:TRINITY_DN32901_c0_g1_i1.p1 TRINITY_DN32901_c0_g1~~TRINITY_DN32901_c0_g1_i1.p1  ORF type:complete len:417 (+),score=69.13 TRINITY_DN32901_c0_g1_i1:131-1381(+)
MSPLSKSFKIAHKGRVIARSLSFNLNGRFFSRNGDSQSSSSSSATGTFVSKLRTRGVLRFDGEDVVKYLQGLVTNDLRRLETSITQEGQGAALPTPNQPASVKHPLYALILTPQGRFLYDMFIYRPPRAEERLDSTGSRPGHDPHQPLLLADVDYDTLDECLAHLKKYRLRSKVEIFDVSKDIKVWQRFPCMEVDKTLNQDDDVKSIGWGAAHDASGSVAAEGSGNSWQWFNDPRLSSLGLRGLFAADTVPPLVDVDKEVDEQYYLLRRLKEGVPEGPKEIPKGEAIPLEYNLAGLNAISFDKGCYVGQEFIARTHHRGVIRKRILPVTFIRDTGEVVDQGVASKSDVIDSSGKAVGIITTAIGSQGLALLRLDAAFKNQSELSIKNLDNVHVKVRKPNWWPSEWSQIGTVTAGAA